MGSILSGIGDAAAGALGALPGIGGIAKGALNGLVNGLTQPGNGGNTAAAGALGKLGSQIIGQEATDANQLYNFGYNGLPTAVGDVTGAFQGNQAEVPDYLKSAIANYANTVGVANPFAKPGTAAPSPFALNPALQAYYTNLNNQLSAGENAQLGNAAAQSGARGLDSAGQLAMRQSIADQYSGQRSQVNSDFWNNMVYQPRIQAGLNLSQLLPQLYQTILGGAQTNYGNYANLLNSGQNGLLNAAQGAFGHYGGGVSSIGGLGNDVYNQQNQTAASLGTLYGLSSGLNSSKRGNSGGNSSGGTKGTPNTDVTFNPDNTSPALASTPDGVVDVTSWNGVPNYTFGG